MNKKTSKRLWFYIIIRVFIALLLTPIFTFALVYIFSNLGFFDAFPDFLARPLFPLIMLLLLSVTIGTGLSLLVFRGVLSPITKFSEASTEVANGNFTVKVDETSKIQEVKDFAHNFNLMTQELSSIETLRDDFIVNVSHEFKTPLSAIEGYATLIQNDHLSEEEKMEYTNMIIEASKQLSTLTGNILELSKLENEDIILEKESIRIDEQIRNAILWLESEWGPKEIEWDLELPITNYWGNKRLSLQIWINLIDNAIKFNSDGGKIAVNLSSTDEKITVSIADTGIGISEETQKKIFDKFFQKDTARNVTGNGLGLSLVHRIIAIFGGKIEIKSEEGIGSNFTIILPVEYEKE